ncbi:hypothetical protein [Methylobacterium sp. E-005]|uniref:hypothetical protein n=1 Tax=Methylobacterium sp. E-005 TaxID=2836549 RepID=UPI001FBBA949|nr:hypothetical protein [Methylobacterium sp. E-005]
MGDLITLPVAPRERLREVHSYGFAAGLILVLMLGTDPGAHQPLRLCLVGPEPLLIETVAAFHHDAEGRRAADKVAAAVLRALQLAEWTIPGSVA